VQEQGSGPDLLLLHGTGGATHSWAGLAPALAKSFRVIAPDLPGHGFTEAVDARRSTLGGMAAATADLCRKMRVRPQLGVGHSAGAAVLARMCLDKAITPAGLVSINGALLPFGGSAGPLFSKAAGVLAALPVLPYLVALHATPRAVVARMIRQTGSELGAAEIDHYRSLVRAPKHVAATLQMMANWDLSALEHELQELRPILYLIACSNDLAVPVAQARRLALRVPGARLEEVPGLGHLGHEEDPALFDRLIRDFAVALGVIGR
jgi:magnesium chelatase accessory protein